TPTPELALPLAAPEYSNLIDRAAFWTAPGTLAEALTFYEAHPPVGLTLTGTGTVGGQALRIFTDPHAKGSFDSPQVEITVITFGAGVAVRADAMAIWIPTKPASAYIGAVSSVDVTVVRPGAAETVRRTLTGAAAQRLADAIDALSLAPSGVFSCPMGRG